MKLMMIQGGFGAGGAEKIMAQVATHRHGKGDQVNVVAMHMPDGGSFFPYPDGIPLTVLAGHVPRNRLLHARRLYAIRRHIRQTRPDMILSFLTKINCLTLMAVRGTGIPVAISERNNARVQSWFWANLQNSLARRAAAVVMQTQGGRDVLPPDLRDRALIVPNVCSAVQFRRLPPVPGLCRFIAVGRLDAQKGFDILIRAFGALPAFPATRLTIYGEGPERAALERQVRDAGLTDRIRLPGLVTTPRGWLEAGDVLVVSSRFEGFSNVVAEAASSGLPIVSFDCPFGPREMIREGLNGLLVPPADEAALTRAMARLALNPDLRDRLSRHPHLIAQHLHPDRVMRLWDAVIEEAMATAAQRAGDHRPRAAVQSRPAASRPSK